MPNKAEKLYVILNAGELTLAYDNKEEAQNKLQWIYDQEREQIREQEGFEGKQLEEVLASQFEYEIKVIVPTDDLWEESYDVYENMIEEDDDYFDLAEEDDENYE